MHYQTAPLRQVYGAYLQAVSAERLRQLLQFHSQLIGILTDGDLRRLLLTRQNPLPALLVTPAIEFGHASPTSIQGEQSLTEAATLMHDKQIWDLPVVDGSKKLLGLIHRHDVN